MKIKSKFKKQTTEALGKRLLFLTIINLSLNFLLRIPELFTPVYFFLTHLAPIFFILLLLLQDINFLLLKYVKICHF